MVLRGFRALTHDIDIEDIDYGYGRRPSVKFNCDIVKQFFQTQKRDKDINRSANYMLTDLLYASLPASARIVLVHSFTSFNLASSREKFAMKIVSCTLVFE